MQRTLHPFFALVPLGLAIAVDKDHSATAVIAHKRLTVSQIALGKIVVVIKQFAVRAKGANNCSLPGNHPSTTLEPIIRTSQRRLLRDNLFRAGNLGKDLPRQSWAGNCHRSPECDSDRPIPCGRRCILPGHRSGRSRGARTSTSRICIPGIPALAYRSLGNSSSSIIQLGFAIV